MKIPGKAILLSNKKVVAVAGFAIVGMILNDSATVNSQTPNKCDTKSVAVITPRPHTALFEKIMPKNLPRLRDVVASRIPDAPISRVAEVNKLEVMGDIPKTSGGVYCLATGGEVTIKPVEFVAPPKPALSIRPIPTKMRGRLSDREIIAAVRAAGFSGNSAIIMGAIVLAESGGNPSSRCYNMHGTCVPRYVMGVTSVDRGIYQINNKAHRDVSDSCAVDIDCSGHAAYRIANHGRNFRPWSTYGNRSYRKFMPRIQAAS